MIKSPKSEQIIESQTPYQNEPINGDLKSSTYESNLERKASKSSSTIESYRILINKNLKLLKFYHFEECYRKIKMYNVDINNNPQSFTTLPIVCDRNLEVYAQLLSEIQLAQNAIQENNLLPNDLECKVMEVIDGDTFKCQFQDSSITKVRLIGVDTPETKHPNRPVEYFGREATSFTREMVEGKKVRLEFDSQDKDKYGRTLAYVFLEDGTFLNAEIIKQGYGFAYTKYPFKYIKEFREYESQARNNGRGLWGD